MFTYNKTHKLAKGVITTIVVALLVGSRYTELGLALDIAAVLVWFWGVNPVAYLIESVTKSKHDHPII